MKLVLVAIALCAAICVASAEKLLASYSRQLNRRETNRIKRLVKRQALNDPNCDRRACAVPNCGKDFVAAALPGECCEKCVPWEYASSLGIQYPQAPQPVYDPRNQYQPSYNSYNQYPYNQPQQNQPRVDVYIFGPDDGARVSTGQSIYLDCEVVSPYNQNAQPRWSRSGNQPLSYKSQVTPLSGNRKISRLSITDASYSDAGRYECSAGTGNQNDQASIDLQVTEGGYYPRPSQPQQPQYDPYNQYPYNQYPYNQPGYYPQQPQPQPEPQPQPQPQPQPDQRPAPGPDAEGEEGEEGEGDEEDDAPADEEGEESDAAKGTTAKTTTTTAAPAAQQDNEEPASPADAGGEDEGEYPEDYTETEK